LTASYEHALFEAYLNIATGAQKATRIVSNQFFFEPEELDYIADNWIYTDHSQNWTISGGGALKLSNALGKLTPSFDFLYGSGLRAGDPAGLIPNGATSQPYFQVNLGIAQTIGHDAEKPVTIRLDVTNLFDTVYLLHDGAGVGSNQPEYGPRRAIFVGINKAF
jgi:outer membrane receptor protein involved in Fe transport